MPDYILHLPIKSKDIKNLNDYLTPKKNKNERHKVILKDGQYIEVRKNIINFNNEKKNKINVLSYSNQTQGKKVRNKTNWARKTDIVCWHCTYNFNTTPCSIPYEKKNKEYTVYGCFCSFNCAKAYLLSFDGNNKWEKLQYLNQLYYEIYGEYCDIKPSHPKEVLIKYGGTITIDDYRKYNDEISCEILIPPLISIQPEIDIKIIKNSFDNKISDIDFTRSRSKSPLRVKKPVKENKVKENSFMKFFT